MRIRVFTGHQRLPQRYRECRRPIYLSLHERAPGRRVNAPDRAERRDPRALARWTRQRLQRGRCPPRGRGGGTGLPRRTPASPSRGRPPGSLTSWRGTRRDSSPWWSATHPRPAVRGADGETRRARRLSQRAEMIRPDRRLPDCSVSQFLRHVDASSCPIVSQFLRPLSHTS